MDDPQGDITPELTAAINQLRAYFDGQLTTFDQPLRVNGTDFQRAEVSASRVDPLP